MDANKLRSEVFEKTGIKVDTTDPIFALVALNEAVLADYASQNLAGLQDATAKLKEQTRLLLDAGERTKALLLQMGHKVDDPAPPASPEPPVAATASLQPKTPGMPMPPLVLASVTALLAAVLVVAAQALFVPAHPVPAISAVPASVQNPAPTQAQIQAVALTPEQQQMMQTGEKFAKAWPKLDAKTQARLHDLMQ